MTSSPTSSSFRSPSTPASWNLFSAQSFLSLCPKCPALISSTDVTPFCVMFVHSFLRSCFTSVVNIYIVTSSFSTSLLHRAKAIMFFCCICDRDSKYFEYMAIMNFEKKIVIYVKYKQLNILWPIN